MTTLLVFPPATDPAHPPLGLPSLAAYAAANGERVRLLDLNLAAYYYFLSPGYLDDCAERLDGRIERLENLAAPTAADIAEYRRIVPDRLSAPYLRDRIADALASFRKPETYADSQTYYDAVTILRRSMSLVSASHYPLEWAPRSLLMKYLPTKSAEVLRATADREANPFIGFFESRLEGIAALDPDLVGISINYYSQLIPGMTLAALVKRLFPRLPVVVGGGLISFFCDDWNALRPFAGIVDVFAPFEGERPLLEIIRALGRGSDISEIEGTIRFVEGGELRFIPPGESLRSDELPAPDYGDLPLHEYLTPEPVLLMQTSRGCYWDRCAFCSHAHLYRGRFARKDGRTVAAEMTELHRRFGTRHFYFTDECIPPRTAIELAKSLSESRLGLNWFGEIRFERSLDEKTIAGLARGGAVMLMFGLESASPRVLDLMRKGTATETISAILRACRAEGILAFIMLFLGFPGETAEEAQRTIDFLLEHRPYIRHIAATRFVLERQSPVYARRDEFGVTPAPNAPDEDLKTFHDYSVRAGLNQEQAREMVCRLREHPELEELADQNVLSRTHFLFLPPKDTRRALPTAEARVWPEGADPYKIRPCRRPDLEALILPYDLHPASEPASDSLEEPKSFGRPVNYLFSPVLEKMLDVGEDGFDLLAPCDGSYSLGRMLDAIGENNRDTALRFYRDLAAAGILDWTEDP
ncbi:MAG: radical SAM protein [Candidatus Aminicenantes bacterium]|nr:radical SAM protein [Candidatus Aminicenantes bacterium]